MFDYMTSDYIMERMLDSVSDQVDKREGSIVYDALMPCALELSNAYAAMDMVLTESFADTASGHYLIKRVAERGMLPEPATYAHVKGIFYGAEIPIGKRYSCGSLNYYVHDILESGKIGQHTYELVCETLGSEANTVLGQLTPISSDDIVPGLSYAEIIDIMIPGEDQENQEVLRERYFSSFTNQAFGGNVKDYKNKTKELDGIGGVKVTSTWNGGGTVKLTIITSDFKKPSEEFVRQVQEKTDPTKDGAGQGFAPIGHIVTVEGVSEKQVNIKTTITCKTGVLFEDIKSQVIAAVDAYFHELSANWEETNNIIVRISQIETRILGVNGVEDIAGTTLNGLEKNAVLEKMEIPVGGVIIG